MRRTIVREALSDLLLRSARRTGVPGAQLAVYHRGELHTCVTGVEDSATGRPVEDASLFPLGSVTKPVTAALVMQLVEDGDVDLDAPVLHHLGGGAPDHPLRGVTARQLLSHTAGLVSERPADAPATSLRRYVSSLTPEDRIAPPGTVFSYSNTGYAVAGRLVEAVTGQDWWETVESHLCWSTGMELAPVPAPRPPAPGLVTGHAVDGAGRAHPVGFHIEPALAPAGGLAASAATLAAFGRAFLDPGHAALDGEVASPEVLGEMGRSVSVADPFGLADGWGAGWSLHLAGDRLWYGHDGTLDGATCNLRVDPEGGTVVALTTNSTTGVTTWEHLVRGLRELGVDVGHYRQPDAAAEGAAATATAPDRVTGRYGNGGLSAEVVHDRGGHRLVMSNGFEGELTTGPGGAFRVVSERHGGIALSGRFLTDPAAPGRATALQYNGRTLRLSGLAVGPNA
ncbi:serine hydrolase domain-containing protein [Nocardiopsis sp. NPDC055824]